MKTSFLNLAVFLSLFSMIFLSCEDDNPTNTKPIPTIETVLLDFSPFSGAIGSTVELKLICSKEFSDSITIFLGEEECSIEEIEFSADTCYVSIQIPQKASSGYISISNQKSYFYSDMFIVEDSSNTEHPAIISFVPQSGSVADTIAIKTVNFENQIDNTKIFVGEYLAEIIKYEINNDIVIFYITVHKDSKTAKIICEINGKKFFSNKFFNIVNEIGNLQINDYEPKQGIVGSIVSISGANIIPDSSLISVFFGNKKAIIKNISNSKIECIVPSIVKDEKIRVLFSGVENPLDQEFKLLHKVFAKLESKNLTWDLYHFVGNLEKKDTTIVNEDFIQFGSASTVYRFGDGLNTIHILNVVSRDVGDSDPFAYDIDSLKFDFDLDTVKSKVSNAYVEFSNKCDPPGRSNPSGALKFIISLDDITGYRENNVFTFNIQKDKIKYLFFQKSVSANYGEVQLYYHFKELFFDSNGSMTLKVWF